jgi:hypothetical protein
LNSRLELTNIADRRCAVSFSYQLRDATYWWVPKFLLITAILIMVLPLTRSRRVKWAFIIVNAIYFGVAFNNLVNALVLGAHGG